MVSLLVLIIIIVIGIIYESSKNSESYSSKTKEYSTKTEESIGEYIERTRKEYLKTHTEKEWEEAAEESRKKRRKAKNKYVYAIDVSYAIRAARKFFLKPKAKAKDIIKLLCKHLHAVKDPFRKFNRPLRGIGAIHFNYR